MTASILMIYGGIVFVVGVVVTAVNFCMAAKNISKMEVDSFFKRFVPHVIGGLVAFFGGIAFMGGFVWFLLDKFAK